MGRVMSPYDYDYEAEGPVPMDLPDPSIISFRGTQDQCDQLERNRARFFRAVAVWVAYLSALALAPIGLWFLTVGQPIGLVVWAVAATIWATARAVEQEGK